MKESLKLFGLSFGVGASCALGVGGVLVLIEELQRKAQQKKNKEFIESLKELNEDLRNILNKDTRVQEQKEFLN